MTLPDHLAYLPPILEIEGVTPETFAAEVQPLSQPAVFRGLVRAWPAVEAGRRGASALIDDLKRFEPQRPIESVRLPPEAKGRVFYSDDLRGFNFTREHTTLGAFLDEVLACAEARDPPGLYAGAVRLADGFNGFVDAHPMPLLGARKRSEMLISLWLGNRTKTPAHWDLPQNLACVLGGRRRFTLFPPDALPDLYVGPLDFTIAGQPLSLVDLHAPDLERFPRFDAALGRASAATLEPGDVLYIPSLWFHHVEGLEPVGAMLNFWWRDGPSHLVTPSLTLLHALLTLRELPDAERRAWRLMFDHYIFQTNGDPWAHVPEAARGLHGPPTPESLARIRQILVQSLSR